MNLDVEFGSDSGSLLGSDVALSISDEAGGRKKYDTRGNNIMQGYLLPTGGIEKSSEKGPTQ